MHRPFETVVPWVLEIVVLDIDKIGLVINTFTCYLSYCRGRKQNNESILLYLVLSTTCVLCVRWELCWCEVILSDTLWHRIILCLAHNTILDVMVSTWESLIPSR